MTDPGRNPYVGPRAFEEQDRLYFFGRDEEARQLTALVAAHRVVLFYAQSGAGKTSLLQARVLPDLAGQGIMAGLPVGRVGGALRQGIDPTSIANIYVFNLLLSLASRAPGPEGAVDPRQLAALTLAEGLRPYLEADSNPPSDAPQPRLLVVDQFEEVFTTYPERSQERGDFFHQLQECLRIYADLGLLLAMREDFIALLDDHASQMPDRLRARFRIERLTRAAALQAVQGPAERAGRRFPPEVAGELVNNLSRLQSGPISEDGGSPEGALGEHVEPVHLQIVCWRLWERIPPEQKEITAEDVRTFGDVDQALIEFYESGLREVQKVVVVGQGLLRALFESALVTSGRTRGQVYRGEQETEGVPNAALELLEKARLIWRVPRGRDTWYELTHDRLVNPILEANRLWREERERAVASSRVPAARPSTPVRTPYVGPRPLSSGEYISGRDREIAALLDLIITERIVLFYSSPGAGKTSLLRAGLAPALDAERFRVLGPLRAGMLPQVNTPGESGPLTANRFVLSVVFALEEQRPEQERLTPAELERLSLSEYLARYPAGPDYAGDVLILDQVEEVLTADAAELAAKDEFFRQLGEALNDPRRRGLLAIREEFIAPLDPYAVHFPGQLHARFRLEPLGAAAALEVLKEGALRGGRAFAPGVAEKLVDQLRTVTVRLSDGTLSQALGPTVEPLQLQIVAYRLWDRLPADAREIGEEDLAGAGTAGAAQREYYAEQVRRAAEASGVSERFLRLWIDTHLIGLQGERLQVPLGAAATEGLPNAACMWLVQSYFLRIDTIRGVQWLSIAGDLFVAPAREDNAEWLGAHESHLQRNSRLWDAQFRPDGLLLTGAALIEAEAWAASNTDALMPVEREFLAASQSAEAAARYRKRAELRIRWLAISVAALALVGFVVAVALWQSAARSESAAVWARSTAVYIARAAEATAAAAQLDRQAALEAGTQVSSARSTAEGGRVTAEAALVSLAANLEAALTQQARPPVQTVPRPEGVTPVPVATSTATRSGIAGPTPPRRPTAARTPTATYTRTPNATVFAQQTQLADARFALTRIAGDTLLPSPLVFTSNRASGSYALWSMSTSGTATRLATTSRADYYRPTVARSSRGVIVVASTANFAGPNGRLDAFLFTPDGGPSQFRIDNPSRGSQWDPAISPDGSTRILFASDAGGVPNIYLLPGVTSASPLNLTNAEVEEHAPAWSPDGKRVAFTRKTAGQSDIWLMDADGTNQERLTDSPRIDTYPAWSPDGQSLAFASNRDDPTNQHPDIYVIDLQTRAIRNLSNTPRIDENYPAWSPDGRYVAYAGFTTNSEIFVAPSVGGVAINVTNNPADDSYPAWW